MGAGFVILFFFACVFAVSFVVAVISGIITYLASGKQKRKRKVIAAFFSPFIGFYTMFFTALISTIVVSSNKGVDEGIGDSWYVPLKQDWKLLMIDSSERAYLEHGDHTVMSDVSQIAQAGDKVYGKISGSFQKEKYFSLNLQDEKVIDYDNLEAMMASEHPKNLKLIDVSAFYDDRRDEIMGAANYMIGLFSVVMGAIAVFIFCRLVLFGVKSGFAGKA